MNEKREEVVQLLERSATGTPPGLAEIRLLASSAHARLIGSPTSVRTDVALRVWAVRLETAEAKNLEFIGLDSLVSRLRALPADEVLQQFVIEGPDATGTVFFDVRHVAQGAVLARHRKTTREASREAAETAVPV